jgi:hypothetical protein
MGMDNPAMNWFTTINARAWQVLTAGGLQVFLMVSRPSRAPQPAQTGVGAG